MRLCLPTVSDAGLESRLSPHFGSAPFFTFLDTESGEVRAEPNDHARHEPGRCTPTKGLEGRGLDAVVCRGLGLRALQALTRAGIPVLATEAWSVSQALADVQGGTARLLAADEACAGGHHHDHDHDHHHGHGHHG